MVTGSQDKSESELRREQAAFEMKVAPYREKLTGFCGRFLRDADDRADAVQETFVRAWRFRASYRGESSFATWLYRIAENVCLDFLKERKKIMLDSLDDAENPVAEIADKGPSEEQLVVWRQMREAVLAQGRAAQPPWDEADWSIYFLHCEREKSFREIGDKLCMGESTVKQRFYRKIQPVIDKVKQAFGEI